jgi:agmatinase
MPAWKSLLSALALAGTAVSCAHHGDAEVVPEHEREELLKKWDQEVNALIPSSSPISHV